MVRLNQEVCQPQFLSVPTRPTQVSSDSTLRSHAKMRIPLLLSTSKTGGFVTPNAKQNVRRIATSMYFGPLNAGLHISVHSFGDALVPKKGKWI